MTDVDAAVTAQNETQQDRTGGRGANGHLSNALKEEQDRAFKDVA